MTIYRGAERYSGSLLYFNYFSQWLFQPIQDPGLLFISIIIFHRLYDSLDEWSARRKADLNTEQHKHRINTYTHQTSMPRVGIEPMIPASERTKTVNALDCEAILTGIYLIMCTWK
jgi:hypothetical protein